MSGLKRSRTVRISSVARLAAPWLDVSDDPTHPEVVDTKGGRQARVARCVAR